MARKIIDIGTIGNDGTGDSIRDSFSKVNDNFLELYSSLGLGEKLKFTGLSDTPSSYVGEENAVLAVNQTTDGLKFKQIVGGSGINVDNITNPNEIILNALFASISGDQNPQLGGNLQATSGGQQYRIQQLITPITDDEAVNKEYADTKLSRAGVNAIDPATGNTNEAFGRMTGPLILSRSPVASDDIVYDGLIAATKAYVDGSAFGSVANLYVATSGEDARAGVGPELQGRALAYAYRTIEAALRRAEELILESRVEIGPYKKVLTYNQGESNCTLADIATSTESGTGFAGSAYMSVDTITLNSPGINYLTGDIITLYGGTGSLATIKVLSTTSSPGAISTFQLLSSGTYTSLPDSNLNIPTTTNSVYGELATFDVTYKVSNVNVQNGGHNYGLVSVRILGGGGTGAFGNADIVDGVIQSITITDSGSGFITQPTVIADLPTLKVYTNGFGTDFTGDYSQSTPGAASTRHIRTGMYLRGETSGALAQILTHNGVIDLAGNELFDVDIQYGTFHLGEVLSFGDVTKNKQITVFIESGIYEENYPLKIPQNVAIVGDEFRRVQIKPRPGPSSSPWAFTHFRRDLTVDDLTVVDSLFGYHYLSDSSQPVYPPIQNPGHYTSAAQLLFTNKAFIQEEVTAWIKHQVTTNTYPFSIFTYDSDKCSRDVGLILNAILGDLVLGTDYLTKTAANSYLRSYTSTVTSVQKEQTITAIEKALELALATIDGSDTIIDTTDALTTSLQLIVTAITDNVPYTDIPTFTNSLGLDADYRRASAILQANRSFIASEITSYISENYTVEDISGYNASTCSRDIAYIVDALVFDLLYSGNSAIITAAIAYWNGSSVVENESAVFAEVMTYFKSILPYVINNQTTWTGKSTTNTVSQDTTLTSASYSGVAAVKLFAEADIITTIIASGVDAAPTVVNPTYATGTQYASLGGDRDTILTNLSLIQTETIAWIDTTYAVPFTYNERLCKRDVGLIIDSMVFDLRYSGYARTISAALKYFEGKTSFGNSLIAITLQLPQTVAAIQHINTLAQQIISNTEIPTVYNVLQTQVIDVAYVAEVGSSEIIAEFISAIVDIIQSSSSVNSPKLNNQLDVFLCNDAVMIRRVTCQGHGGFMMVLDPAGQILAKSPYCQESASFTGATGRKQFAGGMFVDGFAGNLQFRMTKLDESQTKLEVTGLLRRPNLPASVIISGSSYRVNYVRDFVYNVGSFDYNTSKCARDIGLITNAILDDYILGTNYNHVIAAISYVRNYTSTVTTKQKAQTVNGLNYARDLILALVDDSAFETYITNAFTTVTDVISAASAAVAPSVSWTAPIGISSPYANSWQELIDNRSFLIEEIIAYIQSTQNPGSISGYSEATCRRDLGLFIDAFAYDLYYGGNSATLVAVQGYYNGTGASILGSAEVVPTINSFIRLKVVIEYIIKASTSWAKSTGNNSTQSTSGGAGNNTTAAIVQDLVQNVIDVLTDGLTVLPAVVSPTFSSGVNYADHNATKSTIVSNLTTIKDQSIAYINSSYSVGSSATFVLDNATPYTGDVGPQACTVTTGTETVITKIDHGLQPGATIAFTTSGSMPTGLTADVPYYVLLSGLGSNSFKITSTLGSTTPVTTSGTYTGTIRYDRTYELLMPGNRSMLSNDFTQVADLGYGVITTNGGLTEAVSMFTYYCQISYYSINGGQIRSVAGSASHGVYALVAEGADPLEVPTPTDLYYDFAQSIACYYPSSTYANSTSGLIIYVHNYSYVPLNNSELEIDHGNGIIYKYPVNTAYTGADLPTGVARLTLGATTGVSGLSGLYASVADGTIMTVRQNQVVLLSGNLANVAVRPSTGLVLSESPDVYRVLQFTPYSLPADPTTVTITAGTPATFTTGSAHRLLSGYTVSFTTTGSLPTGIDTTTWYYVLSSGLTSTQFQISEFLGGTPISLSSAGTGTTKITNQGLTTTLLRENYSYIQLTVYQPNDYTTTYGTASNTTHVSGVSVTGSISTGTMTVTAVGSGTITNGMHVTGGTLSATTPAVYVVKQLTGTNAATVTPTGSNGGNGVTSFTVSSATGIVAGQIISGNNMPTGAFVGSIVSTTVNIVDYRGDALAMTGNASGAYSFRTAGNTGTYTVTESGVSQTSTTLSLVLDSVTVSSTTDMYVGTPIVFGVSIAVTSTDDLTNYLTTTSTIGLVANMPIRFTGTVFGGLATSTTYYVSQVINSSQFTISATLGGEVYDVSTANGNCTVATYGTIGNLVAGTTYYVAHAIDHTHVVLSTTQGAVSTVVTQTTSSGSIEFVVSGKVPVSVNLNSTSATFTTNYDHGLSTYDVIKLETTGNLPTGINTISHYYVSSTPTSRTFTVSTVPYGTDAGTSGSQNGTHYFSRVSGRVGDKSFAIVGLSPKDETRVIGTTFNWKGQDYIITRYDSPATTFTAYARIFIERINLSTGVQSDTGLANNVLLYVGAVTLKSAVVRGTTGAEGTLTIRISLTRVTGHDLLEIGTGSYADTNYPHEIYGPAVNSLQPGDEVHERTVGRVFYVTTDQYGNFKVGPYFSVDQGTGKVTFSAAIALSNLDGLGFKRGVPIAEFSTDVLMTNNSPDTVPTQSAVRGYIERRLGVTHNGAVVDSASLIPIGTGGFLALDGILAMKANLDMGSTLTNKIVNLADPSAPTDAVNLRSLTLANITGFTFTTPASADLATFTGVGNSVINASVSGDVLISRAGSVLTTSLQSSTVGNSQVKSNAAIDQSKLSLQAATTLSSAPGSFTQSSLGLSAFDSVQFTVTNGWVTIKDNSLTLGKLNQISTGTVLGNNSLGTANVSAIAFSSVVDGGGAIKKSQYGGLGSTGFLRRKSGTGSSDSDYELIEMGAAYTGVADNSKLVQRDSSGDFGARNITVNQLYLDDTRLTLDSAVIGTPSDNTGYIRIYGYRGNGGLLISDGKNAADKQTLYWNNLHAFKTIDGISDAPITASQVQAQLLTSGGTTTSGQITGYWSLTAGSRLQATYSADLAEYYEGDKEYEVGTVLVFGGEKEVTTTKTQGDKRVAGVVSDNAAFAMYEACPGLKNLLALQGRVPCKVVGKITKGDILITSWIPGVAIAATGDVYVGTVVGKALQEYNSDHIGTIEIAVGRT